MSNHAMYHTVAVDFEMADRNDQDEILVDDQNNTGEHQPTTPGDMYHAESAYKTEQRSQPDSPDKSDEYAGIELAERSSLIAKANKLEDQTELLRAQKRSLQELDVRNKLEARRIEKELTEKAELVREQATKIDRYKEDLNRKTQELGKLHAIISQTREEIEPFDDHHFIDGFGRLGANIQSLVKRDFQALRNGVVWKEFETVTEPDDQDYFLQAYIATQIARAFFSDKAQFFDLDSDLEVYQAKFEALLHQYKVPKAEIVKWRVQTIRVGKTLPNDHSQHLVKERGDGLLGDLPKIAQDVARARKGLRMLYRFAFDLALSLRRCTTEYQWAQAESPESFQKEDVDRIEPYNPREGPRGKPAKVLFGPLYKRVDGVRVLLRSGSVLFH